MADFQNIEVMLQQGLLSSNFSTDAFKNIAGKVKQGFNVSVADVFAIVRLLFNHCMRSVHSSRCF